MISSSNLTHRNILKFLQLQPHFLIFLLHLLNFIIIESNLPQSFIFILEYVELSTHVTPAASTPVIALSSQLKQLFKVLYLALKLLDEGIVLGVDFVASNALDDRLCTICKFKS
jgi:hypothetical protein